MYSASTWRSSRNSSDRRSQVRQRTPFRSLAEVQTNLPQGIELSPSQVSTTTRYFDVQGRLRLGDRVLQERSLLELSLIHI